MLSVLNGHTDCVYSLLNKGANVDAKDKWGRTALHRGVRLCYISALFIESKVIYVETIATAFYMQIVIFGGNSIQAVSSN